MLSGGWSEEGRLTFNRLAREVVSDRKDHGGKFDKAFKKWIDEQVLANSKRSEKRKRAFIDTYNDLQIAELAESGDNEQNAYKRLVENGWAV